MTEKIKKEIEKYISLTDSKWIFLSWFDKEKNLIISSGVFSTDKNISTVIDMIYNGLLSIHKDISTIICDIVIDSKLETSIESINSINTQTHGICASTVDFSKSWVVLPKTLWINNANEALWYIKQKNNLSGNIVIYSFTTKRIVTQ